MAPGCALSTTTTRPALRSTTSRTTGIASPARRAVASLTSGCAPVGAASSRHYASWLTCSWRTETRPSCGFAYGFPCGYKHRQLHPPRGRKSPQKPRKRAYFAHRTPFSTTPTFMVLGSFQGKQRFTAFSRQTHQNSDVHRAELNLARVPVECIIGPLEFPRNHPCCVPKGESHGVHRLHYRVGSQVLCRSDTCLGPIVVVGGCSDWAWGSWHILSAPRF